MSHSQKKKTRTKTEQLSDKIGNHLRKRSSVFENLGILDETVSEAQSILNNQQKKSEQKEPVNDKQQQKPKESSKQDFREDSVDIKSNFVKIDADIFEYLLPNLNSAEQVVYMRLYRWSWGYQRNYCQTAYTQLSKPCNMSRTTVIDAIKGLLDKKWIEIIDQNYKTGTTYRVYLPIEKGYESKTKTTTSPESSSLKSSNLDSSSLKSDNVGYQNLAVSNPAVPYKDNNNQDPYSVSDLSSLKSRRKDRIDLKNIDLSLLTNKFYSTIGQSKISKQKRERAEKNIKELTEDGFSQEDISFAIEWTIKNAKEKTYDFSIIKDTIGQAIAAKEETKLKEQKIAEREQKRAEQIEEEKRFDEERQKIESYKESLSTQQRSELRKRALDEIKKSGTIRQELIGPPLIEAKENEILRKEMNFDG